MKSLREVVREFVGKPHDGMFKGTYGDVLVHRALLTRALPPRSVASLELSALEQLSPSFVGPKLQQKHLDLLFRVPSVSLDGEAKVVLYVVSEHLRKSERLVLARMSEYFAEVYRAHAKSDPENSTIPTVVGLVFYNGQANWWLAGGSPDIPEFAGARVLDVRDLAETPFDKTSLPDIAAQLGLLLLAFAGTPDLLTMLDENAELFRKLAASEHYRLHHFALHLIYILRTSEATMAEAAINRLEELVPETREVRRTLHEAYRERFLAEGRQEGLEEGREEGLEAGLRRGIVEGREEGLEAGLRSALYAVLSGRDLLPTTSQAARIQSCSDRSMLTKWLAQAATATSVKQALA